MYIAAHLMRPTRKLGRTTLKRFPIWSCTGRGLPSFSSHLENWCALTAPFHPYPDKTTIRAVYSLLHFPSRHRDSTLWSVLSCGVRTFLQVNTQRSFCLVRPIFKNLYDKGFYCIEDMKSMNYRAAPQYITEAVYS